ncbi:hypothetical protein [Mannheimia haemolytica]|nr:hypothetical protein [Mannheimia haemolytica]
MIMSDREPVGGRLKVWGNLLKRSGSLWKRSVNLWETACGFPSSYPTGYQ